MGEDSFAGGLSEPSDDHRSRQFWSLSLGITTAAHGRWGKAQMVFLSSYSLSDPLTKDESVGLGDGLEARLRHKMTAASQLPLFSVYNFLPLSQSSTFSPGNMLNFKCPFTYMNVGPEV